MNRAVPTPPSTVIGNPVDMSTVLSKLRDQGLTISTALQADHQTEPITQNVSTKAKVKISNESGRGRGRRKTSFN
jgi:hypothetical protein